MKKKILLFIFLLFSSFIISTNIKALNVTPNDIVFTLENGNVITASSGYYADWFGMEAYAPLISWDIDAPLGTVFFRYPAVNQCSETGYLATVSGYIMDSNGISIAQDVVRWEDRGSGTYYYCTTNPINGGISFTCYNVKTNGSFNILDTNFSNNNHRRAISRNLNFECEMTDAQFINEINNSISSNIDKVNSNINKTNEKLDETNKELGELNDNINDDNVDGATDSANDFFNNFEDNDFGLSDIISIPLNTINQITSNSCTELSLPIPFIDKTLTLPCMNTIYQNYFGSFLTIYQTITFGIIAYWVCIQIYAMVKGFKDPNKDEIEVLDL